MCAAIELVDDRAADYANIDVRSLVADNSWNGGIVLSDFKPAWPDLVPLLGRATQNGNLIGEGHGRDILGHPFNSVAWLATQLASRGVTLRAGEVVMTGSVMKTVFPEQDAHYRFDLEGLGCVEVHVSSSDSVFILLKFGVFDVVSEVFCFAVLGAVFGRPQRAPRRRLSRRCPN